METNYERMRGPELAGLTLKMIQATKFKVTEDVSCCSNKYMQALLRSPSFFARCGSNFFVNLSIKFNIVLNFQLLTWLSK